MRGVKPGKRRLFMATERKPKGKMDQAAIMEIYKKLGTPGEQQKLLSKGGGRGTPLTGAGERPGRPPQESAGFCEQKMILGGRFLQQECSGEMMGSAFNGIGFTGYDNNTRKFVSTWMDSMGTAIYLFEGPANPDGRSFTQKCRYAEPVKGPMEWRSTCRLRGDNTISVEVD